MSTRRITRTVAILLALALVLVACTAGDDSSEAPDAARDLTGEADMGAPAATEGGDTAEEATNDGAASGFDEDQGLGSGPLITTEGEITTGRDIIYTAYLTIAVNDVSAASREASQIVSSLGGLLFGQETTGGVEPRTTLVFRVLPEDFGEALDRLGSLGTIRDQRVTADDVTERVVDLQSRINTAEVSVERLRSLLETATAIEDIAALENQLLQRETNLETLRGQLRTIQDQVDLATITVTITEAIVRPAISVDVTSYPGVADAGLSCPGNSTLEVEQGDPVTVCFEITNVGDVPLTDLTLTDPVLGIDLSDLTLVFGQTEGPLEPGESLVYFLAFDVEETVRLQTRVAAIPLDEAGEPLEGRGVADTATAIIVGAEPSGLPGFADGLEASWSLLVFIAGAVVLAAGAIVPFLWLVPVIWLIVRWVRRRSGSNTEQGSAPGEEQEDEEAPEPAGV